MLQQMYLHRVSLNLITKSNKRNINEPALVVLVSNDKLMSIYFLYIQCVYVCETFFNR